MSTIQIAIRISKLIFILLIFSAPLFAQRPASRIRYGASLPAVCNPSAGDVFFRTTAPVGIHNCTAANTWVAGALAAMSGTANILFGTTDADITTGNTGTPNILGISDMTNATANIAFVRTGAASTLGPGIRFFKTRSTTGNANTIVAAGDELGFINAVGADGTEFRQAAAISFEVDAAPGASDMPGRITFWTTPDGSITQTARIRISNAGDFFPVTQGVGSVGIPSFEFNTLNAVNGVRWAGNNQADIGASNVGTQQIFAAFTNTAVGTTGAVTINRMCGRANIATGGTSVVVTNSLVTAATEIWAVSATNDTTARVTAVVPAAGSFTIFTPATTAETAFMFCIMNTD